MGESVGKGDGRQVFLDGSFELMDQSCPDSAESKTFAAPRGPTPQWLLDKVATRRALLNTLDEVEPDALTCILPGVLEGVASYRAQRAAEQAFQDGHEGNVSRFLSARLRQTTSPTQRPE